MTTLAFLFAEVSDTRTNDFNDDISKWDTKRVTSMGGTFWGAFAFNQDLNKWNIAKVTTLYNTFNAACVISLSAIVGPNFCGTMWC